jgi:small subunit ribosomal protein S3
VGQKVNPTGYRVGINIPWSSMWYSRKKDYRKNLIEDVRIRRYLKKELSNAGIAQVTIERMGDKMRITLFTARPGLVIGKKGDDIKSLKEKLKKYTNSSVFLAIHEVRKVELNATLVAERIASQLMKRIAFRRAMKKELQSTTKAGAKGIKVMCSGRLAGADIARTEWYIRGRVPLQTLRADIDYGTAEALTTYGIIGVKVWIFNGEIREERANRGAE